MTEIKIPLAKPFIGYDEIKHMTDVINSGCVAGTCEETHKFEEKFAEYIGSKYAIATSSCTTALHIACEIVGLGKHSDVYVPTYTFPATAYAPIYMGAKVNIVDVKKSTFNIDVPYSTMPINNTLIPVHCLGNPCDMNEIMNCAEDNGHSVIEDAACGIASTIDGQHTGTFGDVGCYSFYGIKELCTGEGGMLVTDNEDYAEEARALVNFGKTPGDPYPNFNFVGYNYRLSAIQAAMGNIQLEKLPSMHKTRTKIADYYTQALQDAFLPGVITPQKALDGAVPSYQRYATVLREDIDRETVIQRMAEHGIQVSLGTYDLSSMPLFKVPYGQNPNGQFLHDHVLSLPMHPGMTLDTAKEVIENLIEVFGRDLS